jgi:hypothetical protein
VALGDLGPILGLAPPLEALIVVNPRTLAGPDPTLRDLLEYSCKGGKKKSFSHLECSQTVKGIFSLSSLVSPSLSRLLETASKRIRQPNWVQTSKDRCFPH